MSLAEILVTLAGVILLAAVAGFFWSERRDGVRAALTASGRQELMILVKGGYRPDVIEVKAGTPVRLNFRREESAACTEMVVFPDFDRAAQLPEGQIVPIDLLPERPGEYQFSCQMEMVRGRLVVT
jgi:plastocyanin domain-containing protein